MPAVRCGMVGLVAFGLYHSVPSVSSLRCRSALGAHNVGRHGGIGPRSAVRSRRPEQRTRLTSTGGVPAGPSHVPRNGFMQLCSICRNRENLVAQPRHVNANHTTPAQARVKCGCGHIRNSASATPPQDHKRQSTQHSSLLGNIMMMSRTKPSTREAYARHVVTTAYTAGYWPTRPSMHSRIRSAWPQCRAYSSIMCTSTSRSCTCPPWMVPHKPQQRHRGGWYGAARQLLGVEVDALHFQGAAIVPQVIVQYAT